MRRKEYAGTDITITFDMKRCVHARNCFLKLPQVFDPSQRPWVQPNNAPAEEIAAMVRTCPSGALAFRKEDADEMIPSINRIAVLENGPLAVAGDVQTDGAESEARQTLCRCGLSKNKPYCDHSHADGGFEATGEPTPKTPPTSDDRGGPVTANRIANGPLKVTGNVELITGTGRSIAKMDKAFLCRCGASKNKPFCDGSHKDAEFLDPID
ncbi:CDGSH iron-sulfur domain-containing protein [Planktotalea sp.]|uniref:CDGSH iron-sulfur domain-containing protein n=1 Tax=Planktotalea sp. TaxID=2029877 RepID=UPI003296AB53